MAKKTRTIIIPLSEIILCLLLAYSAQSSSASPEKGKQIFDSICSACHTIGGGTKVGPDLKGITNQRPMKWMADFISDPAKVIQSGDPIANSLLKQFHGVEMPTLGLSPGKIGDVIAYLRSTAAPAQAPRQKAPTPAPSAQAPVTSVQAPLPPVQPPPPPVQSPAPQGIGPPAGGLAMGEAETGEQLFTGFIPFQKGGPACISCHDVARLPFPGGGTLGPDLTGAFNRYGATGMNSVLATLPFPTMKPLFGNHPLTPQEQQDLEAFLQKAGVQSLISRSVEIGLAAMGGFIILIILVWIIWQNRLVAVRKSLVIKAVGRKE